MIGRKEKEAVLKKGKSILSERPELYNMDINAVLDELNNGTQDMIHNRWGVIAWIVVSSIVNWEIKALVEQLSIVASESLTCKYVGFLLLNEYDVDLEALILEADNCGNFDQIVHYVSDNLQYQKQFKHQRILQILKMLERYSKHNTYTSFLTHYAECIKNFKAFQIAADSLGELKTEAQYALMNLLKRPWYQEDIAQANEMLSCYINQESIWSKRIAVDFLGECLQHDVIVFENFFSYINNMIDEKSDLWIRLIPILMEYVQKKANGLANDIYTQVLNELQQIPDDTTKAKRAFISSFVWLKNPTKDISIIYRETISRPFEDKQIPFELLDHYYCRKIKNEALENAVQELLIIFSVNRYFANYLFFFSKLSSTMNEISGHTADITGQAMKYMLSDNLNQVFFGIGLFVNTGSLQKYLSLPENERLIFSDAQLIRLMKGLLYHTVDSKLICHVSFQLLSLSKDECDQYLKFCMEEVYANYPFRLYSISSDYKTEGIKKQLQLVEMVEKAYQQLLDEQENVRIIKDVLPSYEHQRVYEKAKMKRNQAMNKKADQQSLFAQLFSTRVMKYGIRSAHIVKLSKNQKQFKELPYQYSAYEMDLPIVYVQNPVEFEIKRNAYLEEVKNNAADH